MSSSKQQDNLAKLQKENIELKKNYQILTQSNEFFKKTQKLLLESEEKFRNLFNLSPNGILVFDNNDKIVMYNEGIKEILGKTETDLKGRSFSEFCSENSYESIQACKKKLDSEGICKNVYLNLNIGDHDVPIKLDIANLMDNSGQPFGKMAVITKESEVKQIEFIQKAYEDLLKNKLTDLERADMLKDEFISTASHELKTPLFPIKFQAKTLLEEIYGKINDEQKISLNEIYDNCQKLEILISDLLDLQKINVGSMSFDLRDIDLKKFMNEVFLENKIFFENSNIEFLNETTDSVFFVSDSYKLKQVFRNLVTNSADFVSEDNGKIQISASHSNEMITFLVRDNGIGIPKKDVDNLFKKFHSLNTSRARKFGGTGLGLSISKGIIEFLNGKIFIESEIGKGTTVFFEIPFVHSTSKIQNPVRS